MRSQIQAIGLLMAPVLVAATTAPRSRPISFLPSSGKIDVLATCNAGDETCEWGCMDAGNVCCNDNTAESCDAGYFCIPDACCLIGSTCDGYSSGIGGDDDDDDDDEDDDDSSTGGLCDVGETSCGIDYCMPLTGTCCYDGTYCPNFTECTSDGGCGDFIGGSDDDDDDNDDGFSTTTTFPTSVTDDATLTSMPSATATSDEDDDSLSAVTTGDEEDLPTVTVTATPSATNAPGAGGHFVPDAKMAAGLAVAAAALIL